MKIIETVELINADKVVFGDRDLKLILDTETRRISIDAPAMFTDPVVSLDALKDRIERLQIHLDT